MIRLPSLQADKEFVNKICGKFIVLSYYGKNKHGSRYWLCKCQCGRERKLPTNLLTGNGKRKAYQCNVCTKRNGVLQNQTQEEILNRFWRRFLDQGIRRQIKITISKEDAFLVYVNQNKKCIFSGEELYFTKFTTNFNRYTNASIDRIDSKLPYTLDNVQWVHKIVNMMKGSLSQYDFILWCERVYKFKQ